MKKSFNKYFSLLMILNFLSVGFAINIPFLSNQPNDSSPLVVSITNQVSGSGDVNVDESIIYAGTSCDDLKPVEDVKFSEGFQYHLENNFVINITSNELQTFFIIKGLTRITCIKSDNIIKGKTYSTPDIPLTWSGTNYQSRPQPDSITMEYPGNQ